MTRNYQNVNEAPVTVQGNLHELVRGQEQRLLKDLSLSCVISPSRSTCATSNASTQPVSPR